MQCLVPVSKTQDVTKHAGFLVEFQTEPDSLQHITHGKNVQDDSFPLPVKSHKTDTLGTMGLINTKNHITMCIQYKFKVTSHSIRNIL